MLKSKAWALTAFLIATLVLGACGGANQAANSGGSTNATPATLPQTGATPPAAAPAGGLGGAAGGGAATSAPAAPAASPTAAGAAAEPKATPTPVTSLSVKPGAPGTVTITVVRGAMIATMRKLADKYQQSHPNVKVQVVEEPEGGAFEALIAAGNQPDIVTLSVGTQVGQLAAENALIPLETLPNAQPLLANTNPEITQKIYGHNYYVPVGADVTMLVYNKDLFKEAGLDPNKAPATWDEFLADAQKISGLPNRPNGDKTYGTVFWNDALTYGGWYWNLLMPIYLNANQNQCRLLNQLGTDVVFDQPQCKLADFFTFAKKAQQYAPPTMAKDFFSRDIGMWLQYGYSWEPNLKTAAKQPMVIGQDIGVAPVPVPEAGQTSYSTYGGRLFAIMKTTPQREQLAWDYVQFLSQNDNMLQFDKELGYLPVSKTLAGDPYFQDPARKPFVDELQHAVLPEQFAAADKAANALLGVYQKVVVQGSEQPDQGVQDAATQARNALKAQK